MSESLIDHEARERFRLEWSRNFAVRANAGSGKTTAISARLAAMAMDTEAAPLLAKTAVVTFTKKAAAQIGQRARAVLLQEMTRQGRTEMQAFDQLERAFFGTIHSFCLLLARRYGQHLGIHLNPTVIAESDESWWEEFLEQDAMQFTGLAPEQVSAFLRHVPIEQVFELARELDVAQAQRLLQDKPAGVPPPPSAAILEQILAYPAKGNGRKNIEITHEAARSWCERFADAAAFLPPFAPAGNASGMVSLCRAWMAPLKAWLAQAAAVLGAELALRYRAFRFEHGVQTYADQIEAALAVLHDVTTLERIRAEGWRIILDEAQDTDAQQFAVLVEIARPAGAELGAWPERGGEGPRPGHFCMVGDAQQAIYGARAEIRNFLRHLAAFERGQGGELLTFHVTFRAPRCVVTLLNEGFPHAFGEQQPHNLGVPPAEGAPAPLLQVSYEPLAPGPKNAQGTASVFELVLPTPAPTSVEGWLEEEIAQLSTFLALHGPAGVGAEKWGDVCLVAPRNDWLATARRVMEKQGLKVALQIRRQRQGDSPAFAWTVGLLCVVCDPDNAFEWFGVLREVFGLSDGLLADELRRLAAFRWDDPEEHAPELRRALETVRPFILGVDDGGRTLMQFLEELAQACSLRERLRLLDSSGGQEEELARLVALAADFGREGAGAREWLRELLRQRAEGRAAGKAEADAINLLTSHSAKGLEWPVVIPIGLWRRVGKPPETGLRLLRQASGSLAVFYDNSSIPSDTAEARDRERLRELVRLMYVTLTRVRHHLVIPWNPHFGGKQKAGASFAELWGALPLFDRLPRLAAPAKSLPATTALQLEFPPPLAPRLEGEPLPDLPARVLPHQLSTKPDLVRSARHETTELEIIGAAQGDEAIEYGLWWHETLEHLPWTENETTLRAHIDDSVRRATLNGFAERGQRELELLLHSTAFAEIRNKRWRRLAELSVFAPLSADAWIDGVMDLMLQDAEARELWVVDWKTNRLRRDETVDAALGRLKSEYAPQLAAYGKSAATLFPNHTIRLWIYSSAAGRWTETAP